MPETLTTEQVEEILAAGAAWITEAQLSILATELLALHNRLAAVPTHRNKKRGSEYVLIGIGKMQASTWRISVPWVDMREVAIYRSVDDGSLWVRPREEFEDGRFEALPKEPS